MTSYDDIITPTDWTSAAATERARARRETMTARKIYENGLREARQGDVRVLLFAGSYSGSVQILRGGQWGIARPGEVSYGTVIELTREAAK